jgi:hypothetical protein
MAGPGRLGVGVGVAGAMLDPHAASSSARPLASGDPRRFKLLNEATKYKNKR